MNNIETIQEISAQDLRAIQQQENTLCLIDVRELYEWELMRIPGAQHMPKGNLSLYIETLVQDKNTPVYLYCQGGVRSLQAANLLKNAGYTHLYSLKGGLVDWHMSGYPIER